MGKNVTISGQVREMAEARVMQFLPHDVLQGIKAVDPHPFFAEFIVGHEGVSHGKTILDGIAQKVKKLWSRDTVAKLASKIRGAAITLQGHDEKNRISVGRVVHGFACDGQGGQAEAHGITYIADAEARKRITAGDVDTCSVEADVELTAGSEGYLVEGVSDVPWLVLGGRRDSSPGFPGASILAAVQMMETEDKEMGLTREEVLKGIGEFGLKPSDVFTAGQLESDAKVSALVQEARSKGVSEGKTAAAPELEKAKKDLDEAVKAKAALETETFQLKIRDEARPKIAEYLKGRNLTAAMAEKLTEKAVKELGKLKVEKDKLEEAVKSVCDEGLDLIAAAGVKIEAKADAGKDKGNGADKTTDTTIPDAKAGEDLEDPKVNPFIP